MKWYTCTPVPFKGDHTFFSRDSGAFCKAFQRIGVESRAIMPTPAQEGDDPDLIRTEYANLEDPAWWKSLGIDGLVLYAWGTGKYTPVARAVHEAGIYLVAYMDTSGLFYPWCHWKTLTRHIWNMEKNKRGSLKGALFACLRIIKYHTAGALDQGRRKHLKMANLISFPSPPALLSILDRQWLYGKQTCKKLALIPNPISSQHIYEPALPKHNLIVAVGRWDDFFQKNTKLLMRALEIFASRHTPWIVEIYGNIPPSLHEWHQSLPPDHQSHIHLNGVVPNQELIKVYAKSKICLCTSRYEGSHIASAEALCAGASVVGPRLTPLLNCLQWYVSHDSGTLSPTDSPESVAKALLEEIRAWDEGKRNPEEISRYWCSLLHAENSCKRIIAAYEAAKGGN
ncbi:glycosyltransferase [Akkermansia muciniphila]|uniref:glycosyltransferase n=1 Tax=Akkermansia muciniphila TaxID=239935 RepID=UPI000C9C1FB1|nr:glycosyltransferase [Akkermansia muciniphila]PNC05319.1 hypothetical protein CXU21_09285 [Akkermansia muciniphila]